ncbi:hypothetical protein Taro_003658 [Colocasia esculenta]|uniref:Transmembrane protein n=1 Tax=Colocasia esculenta TaxID=4460 RepID=A0A843TPJ3_COLES|nr:hypothetical protein [Colocasia esculenta]
MPDPNSSSGGSLWSGEDSAEAPPRHWRRMRSVVLASLVPFFLLSLGHYFSVTLLFVDFGVRRVRFLRQRGENFWVFEDAREDVDVLLFTEGAVAVVSFAMLCLSQAAALSASAHVNSGRRPSLGGIFSKVLGLWRGPSMARAYTTVLLLGYVLSLILSVAVVLLVSGGKVSWSALQFLLFVLALLLCVYLGVVGSVGAGSFLLEEGERGELEELCRAGTLMEEGALQGFLVFFLSLVVTHGFLAGSGLWRDHLYTVKVAALQVSPGPILMNGIWMVGAGGFLGYAGVLLQI